MLEFASTRRVCEQLLFESNNILKPITTPTSTWLRPDEFQCVRFTCTQRSREESWDGNFWLKVLLLWRLIFPCLLSSFSLVGILFPLGLSIIILYPVYHLTLFFQHRSSRYGEWRFVLFTPKNLAPFPPHLISSSPIAFSLVFSYSKFPHFTWLPLLATTEKFRMIQNKNDEEKNEDEKLFFPFSLPSSPSLSSFGSTTYKFLSYRKRNRNSCS